MTPRLVAIDVDGTLARSDGTIAVESLDALARARAAGVVVVIATGRPWIVANRTAEEVGHVDHLVCSNGAVVATFPDGDFVRDVYLDDGESDPLVEPLIRLLRDAVPGIGIAVEFERGAKAERGFADRLPPGVPMSDPLDDIMSVLPRPIRKMMAWHDDFDQRLHHLGAMMQTAVEDRAVIGTSGMAFVEVAPLGLNKAAALDDLCDQLGIDAADVVAFGDERNDVEMLRWAGLGVAVANAVPEAQLAADRIGPSNDDHAVATILHELLDG